MRFLSTASLLLFGLLSVSAHPHHTREEAVAQEAAQQALVELVQGHSNFVQEINKESPGLLEQLEKDGQKPTFEFIGCRYVLLIQLDLESEVVFGVAFQ